MVQPIQKITGFRAPVDAKPVAPAPLPPRGFVRSGFRTVPAPHSSSVSASQHAEAEKIRDLFGKVNPGPTNSTYSTRLALHDGEVTLSGRSNELTIKGKDFEMKINDGKFAGADGMPGELPTYRMMLLVEDALRKLAKLQSVWSSTPDEPVGL
ncbi:MAG: hypothetical protein ACRYGA_06760 [Janthinobacterium lividum]